MTWSVELVFKKRSGTVFGQNAYGWIDVLKVEYNDPHKIKFASKLRGFPFTVRTNTVGHYFMGVKKMLPIK